MGSHRIEYYACSKYLLALSLTAALSGCASASTIAAGSPVVRFVTLPEQKEIAQKIGREPVVLSFQTGDRIPLDFGLDSTLFEPVPNPHRLDLEVKRPFFLLVRPDGPPMISLDGKDFDERHRNSFRFGLGVKDKEAHVEVGLGILAKDAPR